MRRVIHRIGFSKEVLHTLDGIRRTPDIRRLERLRTTILNVVHNAVCDKANHIHGAFLINPAAISGYTDIIGMLVDKILNYIIGHFSTPHKRKHWFYPH